MIALILQLEFNRRHCQNVFLRFGLNLKVHVHPFLYVYVHIYGSKLKNLCCLKREIKQVGYSGDNLLTSSSKQFG